MRCGSYTFPDFLIVGAMKAGTTTLHRDLDANPGIFMPFQKELARLCEGDEYLQGEGRAEYANFFAAARPDQIVGEASTQYTKLPTFTGVARRGRELLGPDLRLIYLVREPVKRIISHHYHAYSAGQMGPNIDEEIHRSPELIAYSRYATQIEQWLEFYDQSQVMIVRFEDYVSDRRAWVTKVSQFIGAPPRPDLIDEGAAFNSSEGKVLLRNSFWRRVRRSSLYDRVYPLMPLWMRERVRRIVATPIPPRPAPPSAETVQHIRAELADDMQRLARIMKCDGPVWKADEKPVQAHAAE